jgi:histo-blood group ABO system transferase
MDGADAHNESGGESVRTALLVIATGEKYHQYVNPLLESAREFFVEHDAFVWTDVHVGASAIDAKFVVAKEPLGYPNETLYRYHTILQQRSLLAKYDYLFYLDVDMRMVAPVGKEIFSNSITACLHPGYVNEVGSPERRPESMAAIPYNAKNKYFCGGFNGGFSGAFLGMAAELAWCIDKDTEKGILAVWHDESHLNRYLHDHPPSKILDPSYCYPEGAGDHYLNKWKAAGINPTPKILALTKAGR